MENWSLIQISAIAKNDYRKYSYHIIQTRKLVIAKLLYEAIMRRDHKSTLEVRETLSVSSLRRTIASRAEICVKFLLIVYKGRLCAAPTEGKDALAVEGNLRHTYELDDQSQISYKLRPLLMPLCERRVMWDDK